jgi:hypothetical protein
MQKIDFAKLIGFETVTASVTGNLDLSEGRSATNWGQRPLF